MLYMARGSWEVSKDIDQVTQNPLMVSAPVNGIIKLGPKAEKSPSILIESLFLEKLSPVDKGFYGFVAPPELTESKWKGIASRGELVEKALAFFTGSIVSVNNTKSTERMEYHVMSFKGLSNIISLAKYSMEHFVLSSIKKTENNGTLIYEVFLGEEDYFNLEYISKVVNFDFI